MTEGVDVGVEYVERRHAYEVLVSRVALIRPSLHVKSCNIIVRSGHSICNRSSRSRGELEICQTEEKAWQHVARVVVTGTRASIFAQGLAAWTRKEDGEIIILLQRSRVERRYVSLGHGMANGMVGPGVGMICMHVAEINFLRDHDV